MAAAGAGRLDASEGGEDFFFPLDVVSAECTVSLFSPPPLPFLRVFFRNTNTHSLALYVSLAFLNSVLAFARLNALQNPPRASKTLERLWRKKEKKNGIKRDTVRSLQLRGGAIIRRGKKRRNE